MDYEIDYSLDWTIENTAQMSLRLRSSRLASVNAPNGPGRTDRNSLDLARNLCLGQDSLIKKKAGGSLTT